MTFVSFFYALKSAFEWVVNSKFVFAIKSAFEWVVNSKFVFAIFSIFIFIIAIRSFLRFIWRCVRD